MDKNTVQLIHDEAIVLLLNGTLLPQTQSFTTDYPLPLDSSITRSATSSSDSSVFIFTPSTGVESTDFIPGLARGVLGVPGAELQLANISGGMG